MAYVKYTGRAGIRELFAADLEKSGVEGFRKTQFYRGIATKVDEAAAKALTENEELYGKFELVETEQSASTDESAGEATADVAPAAKAAKK